MVKGYWLIVVRSEKYRSITTGHYRFALGAILVYDISNADSFRNCRYWLENIRNYADENVVIALVGKFLILTLPFPGNKCDVLQVNSTKR